MNSLIRWWRTKQMEWWCPCFREDMPPDKAGKYYARAFTESAFGHQCLKFEAIVEGLREAYWIARWEALQLDARTPYADGELGIKWSVTKVQE